MHKTSVGDIVFSFADAQVKAIGIVIEHCATATIGDKGDNWDDEGWLVQS